MNKRILSLILSLILLFTAIPCRASAEETVSDLPGYANVTRIYGSTRYETALQAAEFYKKILNTDKLHGFIVASGEGFADALSGSYLSHVYNLPILLTNGKNTAQLKSYIMDNTYPGGVVYILGGTAAVPESMETGLDDRLVIRLSGADRYETNLAILREAGASPGDVAICTGKGFADSLSASALGLPILLVKDSLTAEQKAFLNTGNTGTQFIIGGTGAVSTSIEKQLQEYGAVERIGGNTRYETSILVAKRFFTRPERAFFASANNFPDGLCAGPMAMLYSAPLILTSTGNRDLATTFVQERRIETGYVLGGPKLISDKAIREIFTTAELKPQPGNREIELDILEDMNRVRTEQGLGTLAFDEILYPGVVIRANEYLYWDVVQRHQGDPHHRPNGECYFDVFNDIGIGAAAYTSHGEILAANTDPGELFNSWMGSPGHKALILMDYYTHVSIGVIYDNGLYYACAIFWGELTASGQEYYNKQ